MARSRLAGVSRRRVLRALCAASVEVRFHGGEIVVVCPGRHLRLGGRRGVGPVLLGHLLKELAAAGIPADQVEARLGRNVDARRRAARPSNGLSRCPTQRKKR